MPSLFEIGTRFHSPESAATEAVPLANDIIARWNAASLLAIHTFRASQGLNVTTVTYNRLRAVRFSAGTGAIRIRREGLTVIGCDVTNRAINRDARKPSDHIRVAAYAFQVGIAADSVDDAASRLGGVISIGKSGAAVNRETIHRVGDVLSILLRQTLGQRGCRSHRDRSASYHWLPLARGRKSQGSASRTNPRRI